MPYVSLSVSVPVSEGKKHVIQEEIGKLISIIPGKTAAGTMIRIEGDCDISMGGVQSKSAFCEIRIFGQAPLECKEELHSRLYQLFHDELDIESLYLNFCVFEEWGSGAAYRSM